MEVVKARSLPVKSTDVDYNKCLDKVAWDFQHDFGGQKWPVCGPEPVGDAVALSKKLLGEYAPSRALKK